MILEIVLLVEEFTGMSYLILGTLIIEIMEVVSIRLLQILSTLLVSVFCLTVFGCFLMYKDSYIFRLL